MIINSTTVGAQQNAVIVGLIGGGYVAVWDDDSQTAADLSSTAIRASIFDADGLLVVDEILVNTTFAGAQSQADVIALSDGGFAVVFMDSSSGGIRARLFDGDGNPRSSSDFLVSDPTTHNAGLPKIAELSDGAYVVVWEGQGTLRDVFARIVKSDGSTIDINVTLNFDQSQFKPEVIAVPPGNFLQDGGFVVLVHNPQNFQPQKIFARFFDNEGNPVETDWTVSGDPFRTGIFYLTDPNETATEPNATVLENGSIAFVWRGIESGGSATVFKLLILDPVTGNVVDKEFVSANENASFSAVYDIESLPSGGFVVAWIDSYQSGTMKHLNAQQFDSSGEKIGDQFAGEVTPSSGDAFDLSMAITEDGKVLGLFTDNTNSGVNNDIDWEIRLYQMFQLQTEDDPFAGLLETTTNIYKEAVTFAQIGRFESEQWSASLNPQFWRALTNDQFGLEDSASFEDPDGDIHTYEAHNGWYEADLANAQAVIGIVDGKQTLVVTFRGTDAFDDVADYPNFDDHYDKLRPFTEAVLNFAADESNGVEQVVAVGHSLGGAMVQKFMTESILEGTGVEMRGVTFGSPGGDLLWADGEDPRVVNFLHTGDPVVLAGESGLKERIGQDIWITYEDIGLSPPHFLDNYALSLDKFLDLAHLGPGVPPITEAAETLRDLLEEDPVQFEPGFETRLVLGTRNGETLSDGFDGRSTSEHFFGSDGADRLVSNGGGDTMEGGEGADTLGGARIAPDYLIGGVGSDVLSGYGGDDTLEGGDGVDVLNGGWGGDLLIGGQGADQINTGPVGDDTVRYESLLDAGDVIRGFNGNSAFGIFGQDVIDLDALFDALEFDSTSRVEGEGFIVVEASRNSKELWVDGDNNNATGQNGGFEILLCTVQTTGGRFSSFGVEDVIYDVPNVFS